MAVTRTFYVGERETGPMLVNAFALRRCGNGEEMVLVSYGSVKKNIGVHRERLRILTSCDSQTLKVYRFFGLRRVSLKKCIHNIGHIYVDIESIRLL